MTDGTVDTEGEAMASQYECCSCADRAMTHYRGYCITVDRLHGHPGRPWNFVSQEYTGPGDRRHGDARNLLEAIQLIDEQLDDA